MCVALGVVCAPSVCGSGAAHRRRGLRSAAALRYLLLELFTWWLVHILPAVVLWDYGYVFMLLQALTLESDTTDLLNTNRTPVSTDEAKYWFLAGALVA